MSCIFLIRIPYSRSKTTSTESNFHDDRCFQRKRRLYLYKYAPFLCLSKMGPRVKLKREEKEEEDCKGMDVYEIHRLFCRFIHYKPQALTMENFELTVNKVFPSGHIRLYHFAFPWLRSHVTLVLCKKKTDHEENDNFAKHPSTTMSTTTLHITTLPFDAVTFVL